MSYLIDLIKKRKIHHKTENLQNNLVDVNIGDDGPEYMLELIC